MKCYTNRVIQCSQPQATTQNQSELDSLNQDTTCFLPLQDQHAPADLNSQPEQALHDDINTESGTKSSFEIIGDNIDVMVSPASMTLDNQRKSFHWFLLMVKQKQVSFDDLQHEGPMPDQQHILDIPTHNWIPSGTQISQIKQNCIFHVSKVLLKYVKCLETVISYPDYIPHRFMHLTKKKSLFMNSDLIDASENSSQGMITIMQKVHELAVPCSSTGKVLEKVVFGGDVLTNERAFSAQEAMQNNATGFDTLQGIIHRPEGLHREFNFLSVIF